MRPYVQDLLLGLPPLFPGWQFKFFTPAWNEPFETRGTNVEVVVCDEVSKSRLRRVWFEQTRLPRLIAAHKVDLWLGTCNYLPLLAACRTFLIVQSHQFFTNPEAFGSLRRFFLQWVVTRSVELADRTAVQCEDAKRTLLKYVDMPADSISIVYNRLVDVNVDVNVPDAAPGLSDLIGCDRPYLLYVSGLYPFKNHARLIEAFARIRPRFADLALVLAGGGPDRDLRSEAARHGIQNDVIFLGKVPQPAIPVLYRNALASVFPSLEETFGLPVLEAMSLDCPVLTSNRSSMAEIAGDAAVLVDPESVDELAEGMIRLLTNDSERQKQIERGRARCRYFTKEKTIRSLAAALESVANLEPVQTGLIPGVPIRPAA
jgi:glycosyltransferase involved in cell wall biosynthesis